MHGEKIYLKLHIITNRNYENDNYSIYIPAVDESIIFAFVNFSNEIID